MNWSYPSYVHKQGKPAVDAVVCHPNFLFSSWIKTSQTSAYRLHLQNVVVSFVLVGGLDTAEWPIVVCFQKTMDKLPATITSFVRHFVIFDELGLSINAD